MKISIIIPVYNTGNETKCLIESIYTNNYSDIEIIIADDGSSEETRDILRKISSIHKEIRLFELPHQGVAKTRNFGISQASGDYVYFADSDDLVKPNFLSEISAFIESHNYPDVVVFGFEQYMGKHLHVKKFPENFFDGNEIRQNYDKHFDTRCQYAIQGAPWNKIFKLSTISRYSIQYPNYQRHEDEGFITNVMNYVENVYFTTGIYYIHFCNKFSNIKRKYTKSYESNKQIFVFTLEFYEKWNPNNIKLIQSFRAQYLYNIIKDCDHFDFVDTKKILLENLDEYYKTDLSKNDFPSAKNKQIKKVFDACINKKYHKIRRIFRFRRFLEKYCSRLLSIKKTKGM